jgi:hypothetical protein
MGVKEVVSTFKKFNHKNTLPDKIFSYYYCG